MSFVKWWFTQQALPKSAILTDIVSKDISSKVFSEAALLDLSRLIPEIPGVMISLEFIS
jgi:hypothetical protein